MVTVSYTDNTGKSDYSKATQQKKLHWLMYKGSLRKQRQRMREWIATGRTLQIVWSFGRLVEMHMLVGSFPKQDCEEKTVNNPA